MVEERLEQAPASAPSPQTGTDPGVDGRKQRGTWRERYAAWVEPRPDGLPRVRVLLAFPVAVAVVVVVLTTLGLSGSSSGFMRQWFETGADPDLIAFDPQPVRSDEWAVQTVYVVSQVELGLPLRNDALPAGVDMSLNWETPYLEWSTVFRPHNLGFLVLPLDHAFALKWWLPGAALAAAASMFLVSLWPRRPVAAAMTGSAFLLSPFFQWWYIPQTLWPVTWALLVMTAIVWVTAARSARTRWLWGAVCAYVTITAALGIYAPFLIPAAYVALFFGIGWVLRRDTGEMARVRLRRVVPVLVGGAVGALVTAVFLVTRWSTIEGFLGTVYPGQRLVAPGAGLADPDKEATFLGVFSLALRDGSSLGIRSNSSEASTFVLVGGFLALVALWIVLRAWRTRRFLDVPLLAAAACGTVFMAFLYVPGWDRLAHLMLLDRVPAERMQLGLGLVSIVVIGLVVHALDRDDLRAPWWLAVGVAGLVLVSHVVLSRVLSDRPAALAAAGPWFLLAAVMAAAVLLYSRRAVVWAAACYLLLSGALSAWVNPVYRGVYDLRETEVARVVSDLDERVPGRWVGVGDAWVGSLLTATGVGGFNAFQAAPDPDTWSVIDPRGRYEVEWNRFGNVGWTVDPAQPRIFNPAADQIRVNFDSCAPYEQQAVTHVLADRSLDQSCLALVDTVEEVGATYQIYKIVPRP